MRLSIIIIMPYSKSKIVTLLEDVIGLHENCDIEKFDPDKTIYDLKTKSIKSGTVVILVDVCKDSKSSLVMIDNDLFWVQTKALGH